MGADLTITVGEVMRLVAQLEAAETKEGKNVARSLIALKVAKLSGESMQAAFEALRPAPVKAQTMGRMGGRAVAAASSAPMKDAPLEQVVEGLVSKLELVPVKRCVCGKAIDADHLLVAAYGTWCCPDRVGSTAPAADDVPWGNAP